MLRILTRALQRQWRVAAAVAAGVFLLGWVFGPRLVTWTARARLVLRSPGWSPARAQDFVQGAAVLEEASRTLGYEPGPWLLRDLSVRPQEASLLLAFSAGGPGRALDAVNAVGKAFESLASAARRDELDAETKRIEDLIAARRRELEGLGSALQPRLDALTRSLEAARSEATLASARIEALRKTIERNDSGPVGAIHTTESDRLALEADLASRRLKELRAQYPEDWPPVVRAAEDLDDLKNRHVAATNREILAAKFAPVRAAIEEIRTLSAQRERRLAEIPVYEEEYLRLRTAAPAGTADSAPRRAAIVSALKDLEARRTAIELGRGAGDAVVQRFEPATAGSAAAGPFFALLGISALAALLAAWGRETLSPTLRTEHDIRRYVNLPLLAVVPHSEPNTRTLPSAGQTVTEAYNTLAALIETRTKEDGSRLFAVSSAVPSEGKSTAACNLAVALARAGSRVLLVDADLRRGVQHKLFSVSNDPGLSSYLQGGTDTVDSMVCSTDVDNLTLMPAGAPMQNPIPFLHSERFNALLRDLRGWYEYVILDLPPVRSAADALIVAPLADAVLLVAAAAQTRKDDITYVKRMIRSVNAKICGCVLTKARVPGGGYYYYPSTPAAEAAE